MYCHCIPAVHHEQEKLPLVEVEKQTFKLRVILEIAISRLQFALLLVKFLQPGDSEVAICYFVSIF